VTERERQFADAARVVDESVVIHILSAVGSAFQARRTATLKGSPYKWVVMIITGCITHTLLLQWMPDRIAPVKPLAYGMVLAFGAFAAAAGFITTRSSATATADSSAGTAKTRKS
jgi:hypothetical protein